MNRSPEEQSQLDETTEYARQIADLLEAAFADREDAPTPDEDTGLLFDVHGPQGFDKAPGRISVYYTGGPKTDVIQDLLGVTARLTSYSPRWERQVLVTRHYTPEENAARNQRSRRRWQAEQEAYYYTQQAARDGFCD